MLDKWRRVYDQATMVGWDFSALDGQLSADEPWWDFEEDCRSAMVRAGRIADLGTGGGERLLALLNPDMDKSIVATEGWEPNVAVARQALAPRGIAIVRYDSERDMRMPFADGSLDLVMSRHESIDVKEIARVLGPGGRLLTQQVAGNDAEEIHDWFDEPFEYPHVTSRRFVEDIEAAGLCIDEVDDWTGMMKFESVRTLVTYLALTPWDAPNFSVSEHEAQLVALDAARPIAVTQRRFRVYATKP